MQAADLAEKVVLLLLPAELLSCIIDLPDDVDLHLLSQTCRTLHHLALRTLFNRHCKAVFAGNLILKDPPPFLLPALHGAIFVNDIRRVQVFFSADIRCFYSQARVLTELIDRLPSNDALSINMGLVGETLRDSESDTYIDSQELTSALQCLMDVALKKGCAHLIIVTNPWLKTLYPGQKTRSKANRVATFVKQLGSVFSSSGKHLGRSVMKGSKGIEHSSSPCKMVPSESIKNGMNAGIINVSTDLLLEPFFSDWTLNLLNHSSLTRLAFSAKNFKLNALQQFLPQIDIPHLEQFALQAGRFDLHLGDLAQFLQRHSKTLSLIAFITPSDDIVPGPEPSSPLSLNLPKLSCLILSSYYFPWFLAALTSNPAKAGPRHLSNIIVEISGEVAGAPNLSQAFGSIAKFSKRSATTSSRLTLNAKQEYPAQFIPRLRRTSSATSTIAFPTIRELHLQVSGDRLTDDLAEDLFGALPGFLALFPHLVKLRLSEVNVGLGKKQGAGYWQRLKKRCSKLRTVRLNTSDELLLDNMSWESLK